MKRLLPAGFGRSGIRTVWVLSLLGALKAAALVVLAEAVARGIVGVIDGTDAWRGAVAFGIGAAVLRAAVVWVTSVVAAAAAIGTKERLRHDLAERAMAGSTGSVGSVVTLATRGLDDLDHYFSKVLPAVATVATVPLLVGTRILFADWVSGVVIVVTVPLVPVFMALIGMQTAERVTAASAALARLSDHLVELARGLPVLVGLGRVDEQSAALEKISREYRIRTMATLRTAFMSSLALELIATISVAVVAVFIGFRLVNGSLPLEVGLLVLILAPECYAPLRDLGSAFHAASDGVAAVNRVRAVIDTPRGVSLLDATTSTSGITGHEPLSESAALISVRGLTVSRAGRGVIVEAMDFDLPRRGVTAIAGASGRGKSTVLAVLAGRLRSAEGVEVGGDVQTHSPLNVALAPQHPVAAESTCVDELRAYGATDAWGLLTRFGLSDVAEAHPAQLSAGELRRLAIARVAARVECGATLVILDEPTAHLGEKHARMVRDEIAAMGRVASVIVASHDSTIGAIADQVVWLRGSPTAQNPRMTSDEDPGLEPTVELDAPVGTGQEASKLSPETDSLPAPQREAETPAAEQQRSALHRVIASQLPRFALAVALGTMASLFAVALTAVSGWLIVRASQNPAIMYLLVAIVGVRFFGIGRSVVRYAERLVTHDAVFRSIGALRSRMWSQFAALGPGSRVLAQGGRALDYLVLAADEIRDLIPRVVMPPLVALATSVAAVITFAVLAPSTVLVLVGCLLVCLVVAPALALVVDRRAGRAGLAARSDMIRFFAAVLNAADDLGGNGVGDAARRRLDRVDAHAGMLARRGSSALGVGSALVAGIGGICAMLVLSASAAEVASGLIRPEIVAVLVLIPLALTEPLLGAVDAVQQWPTLRAALRRIGELEAPATAAGDIALSTVSTVQLEDLAAAWPGSTDFAVAGVSATAHLGDWVVVTGPSGSGKSTLLSVLLGHIRPAGGSYRLDSFDAQEVLTEDLRRLVAWCPQEAHLFDSTLRANLLLGRPRNDAPTDAEMRDALVRAGLSQLLTRLPDGLDTRIGSAGGSLSGGERQRVAVARTVLTRADVVLLDEPTAHLDPATADELMKDLRLAFQDRIVVLVTHHDSDVSPGDHRLRLGADPLREASVA